MASTTHRSPSLSVLNAALGIGVQVVPRIPPWLKRLLVGGKRVTIDGNTLDSTVQLVLAAQRTTRTGGLSAANDPEVARTLMRSSHSVMGARVAVTALIDDERRSELGKIAFVGSEQIDEVHSAA